MTQIEVTSIERDVPIPDASSGKRGRALLYPVEQLEKGESFEFPLVKRPSVQSLASRVKRDYPDRDFTVRKEDDVTARIWRTA